MNERATCVTCPYWNAATGVRNRSDVWECRARPPSLPTREVIDRADFEGNPIDAQKATWPMTEGWDWCGDHPDFEAEGGD